MSQAAALLARAETQPNGCMIWRGAVNEHGYGVVERGGVNRYVHRIVAGAAPGQVVRHSCDTPRCINPCHLSIGTQADNIAEAVARKRIAKGRALPQTKLTEAEVAAIRSEYAVGGVSQAALGKKYGVHQVTISLIVRNLQWAS